MERTPRNDPNPRPDGSPRTAATTSPFTVPEPDASQLRAAAPSTALVEAVERIEKPWGHEEVFGLLEKRYVGKVLYINAGCALSLQWHRLKDETVSVRSGRVTVDHGEDAGRLEQLTLGPGQRMHIRAGVVHRLTALVDSELLEVSTAWPGWRTDVFRIDDSYGRTGTSTP